jgi:hypothetical protein
MTYKVVQWVTGNLGRSAVQTILKPPTLATVGVRASTAEFTPRQMAASWWVPGAIGCAIGSFRCQTRSGFRRPASPNVPGPITCLFGGGPATLPSHSDSGSTGEVTRAQPRRGACDRPPDHEAANAQGVGYSTWDLDSSTSHPNTMHTLQGKV